MNIESLTTLSPPLLQLALNFWMLIDLWKIEKTKKKKKKWAIPKIQRINGVVAFEFHFI
jgi:hypothetical protein